MDLSDNRIRLTLNFPCSLNAYWFPFARKGQKFATMIVSDKGRDYRNYVSGIIDEFKLEGRFTNGEILEVCLKLYPRDKRRRDVDNYTKGLFDALSKSNFWTDDKQVKKLSIEMMEVCKGGKIVMDIFQIGQEQVQKQKKLQLSEPAPF